MRNLDINLPLSFFLALIFWTHIINFFNAKENQTTCSCAFCVVIIHFAVYQKEMKLILNKIKKKKKINIFTPEYLLTSKKIE